MKTEAQVELEAKKCKDCNAHLLCKKHQVEMHKAMNPMTNKREGKMKTYQEVADAVFGEGISMVSDRFVNYMKARWADSEETKCLTGYAKEWAERFKSGTEYHASDMEGRRVLQTI